MERLDIVGEHGEPTGETASREDVHSLGLRHRTAHVWLYRIKDGKAQLLLQRRSRDKESFPDCFDVSSAGHIPAGEDFIESAIRELREELGITARADALIFCGTRSFNITETFYGKAFRDNQVTNVYLLYCGMNAGEFDIQKSELQYVCWMDAAACVNMVKHNLQPHCIWPGELDMIAPHITGNQ